MEALNLETIGKIHAGFKSGGLRLVLAESCTAGLVAHALTSVAGALGFFDASIVCYSEESKERLLGISGSFLREYGAVSEETTRAMAVAARNLLGADVSLAVTGVLGPRKAGDADVGRVYVAVSRREGTESRGFMFAGGRGEIKYAACNAALDFLYEKAAAG